MKVAVVGSRGLSVRDLAPFLPADTEEIVTGGARGIDTCAAAYAKEKGLKLTVFYPDYEAFGKSAPLRRNVEIVEYADFIVAFWDGKSHGTEYVVNLCRARGVPFSVFPASLCERG